jgi:non-specific protein-tyrosine kinase
MELQQLTAALRRWWWVILASVIVAALTSFLVTRATPSIYEAHATLQVGDVANPNPDQNTMALGQSLAGFYAELVKREPVLRGTLEALKLDWDWQGLRDMVSSRTQISSPFIEISVVDSDPQRAQVLANELARQLIQQSPQGNEEQRREQDRQFTRQQLAALQTRIKGAEDELKQLDETIAAATSRRQIEDARAQQATLNTQITTWQSTYAQLQSNLLVGVPNTLRVLEPASLPTVPVGPKLMQNVLLAALVGLVLALAAVVLIEVIDDTLKTTEDARRALSLPVLGSVARFGGNNYADRLVYSAQENSKQAEAYRVLRTNLQFSTVGKPMKTLMITSSKPKEGKSTTAANLAIIVAQSGKRVILVDADLRRPVQHLVFELDNAQGLSSTFLDAKVSIDRFLKPVTTDSLSVLPSGPVPHNPSELLDSARMIEVIEDLKQRADIVIFDSPPVLSVADATILASKMDGVMLVVDSGYTRRGTAKRAKEVLQSIGANLIGVVVNRAVTRAESDYYDYSYGADGQKHPNKRRLKLGKPAPQPAAAAATTAPDNGALKPVRLSKPAAQADANGKGASPERAN